MAGKAPNIRSYTVYKYGSGQPYICSIMRPKGVKDQEVTHSVMSKDESIDSVISKDDVVSKYEPMMT